MTKLVQRIETQMHWHEQCLNTTQTITIKHSHSFLHTFLHFLSTQTREEKKNDTHTHRGWELTWAQRQGVCRERDNLVEALEETAIATKRTTRVPNTAINPHRFPPALVSISASFPIWKKKNPKENPKENPRNSFPVNMISVALLLRKTEWTQKWVSVFLSVCVSFWRVKLVDGNK